MPRRRAAGPPRALLVALSFCCTGIVVAQTQVDPSTATGKIVFAYSVSGCFKIVIGTLIGQVSDGTR